METQQLMMAHEEELLYRYISPTARGSHVFHLVGVEHDCGYGMTLGIENATRVPDAPRVRLKCICGEERDFDVYPGPLPGDWWDDDEDEEGEV